MSPPVVPLEALQALALREQVRVLRDGGFERQARLAVRQRREQETEDTASGGQLHQRRAVFALAGNDHDQLGEVLSELSHHRGDVGGARRIDDQHTGLQIGKLAGDVIEVRSWARPRCPAGPPS